MSPHLLSQCVTSLHNNTYDTHILSTLSSSSSSRPTCGASQTFSVCLGMVSCWQQLRANYDHLQSILTSDICNQSQEPELWEKFLATPGPCCVSHVCILCHVLMSDYLQFYIWPLMLQFVCLVLCDEMQGWDYKLKHQVSCVTLLQDCNTVSSLVTLRHHKLWPT